MFTRKSQIKGRKRRTRGVKEEQRSKNGEREEKKIEKYVEVWWAKKGNGSKKAILSKIINESI